MGRPRGREGLGGYSCPQESRITAGEEEIEPYRPAVLGNVYTVVLAAGVDGAPRLRNKRIECAVCGDVIILKERSLS